MKLTVIKKVRVYNTGEKSALVIVMRDEIHKDNLSSKCGHEVFLSQNACPLWVS